MCPLGVPRECRQFKDIGLQASVSVIPAKAGIQNPVAGKYAFAANGLWIPAFAGMTVNMTTLPSISPPAVLHGQRAAWMQTVGQVRQRHNGLRAGPHSDPSSPPFGAGVAAAGGSPSPCTPENGYLPLGAEYTRSGINGD